MSGAFLPPANLQDLAQRITQAPVHDELVLEGFHHHLQGFKIRMGTQSEQLLGCMDAASSLMRSLTHLGEHRALEVRDMVVRLLSLVYDESTAPAGTSPEDPQAALPESVSRAGLRTMNDMALGEVMVQLGLISTDQIDVALRQLTHTGKQFGETLVDLGICNWEAVEQGLNLQKALSSASAGKEVAEEASTIQSILLGEMLIAMGKIDRSQLDQGLAFQLKMKVRIGAALVALGIITWPDVTEAVKAQEYQRFPKRRT